ncbi:thioredoxin [[Phormidium ambiguum] IAM M-71]|uniref:Thioredoxin n=1 Tax=[Phormidium ambiguum] IAM M-71 TaxID=454136 RepID=A0A1U7IEH2_9CYAN|nr:thioredoxin [Phormidium ambiguum]OKH35372.1 thioredoxin [Phormidium ambiguum IAM M-71]
MATKQEFTSFADLLSQSELPVLVDFYAEWCGPCKMMATILEQVNDELSDRLRIVKINSEKYPELASQYDIYALPTLILFKNAEPVERIEGVVQPKQLIQRLQSFI